MKEAKRTQITEQICEQIRLMRKGGANQTEIGKLLGISAPTISRIETAGFDVEKYLENKRAQRERETKRKQEAEEPAEEQVPGQLEMDLTPAEEHEETLGDMQIKMMRFQAQMTERIVKAEGDSQVLICMKLDKLNDTLCQILRAVSGNERVHRKR